MYCYRHPNVETFLRCGKCDRPICTKCTRIGPAGARCPDCAALRSSPLYRVAPNRFAIAAVAGLVASTAVGCAMLFLSGFGWFLFWAGFLAGTALGEVMLRALERKRGPTAEALTVVTVTVGMLLAFVVWMLSRGEPIGAAAFQRHLYYFISAAIAVFAAVGRIRYI